MSVKAIAVNPENPSTFIEITLPMPQPGEHDLLVEVKAVETILPVHKAVLMSYMKLLDVPLGLLINFHEAKLTDGVNRLILPGANQPG